MSNRTKIKPLAPSKAPGGIVPKYNTNGGKVCLAYLHPGTVYGEFMRSTVQLMVYDAEHNQRLWNGGGITEYQAGANLSDPRNGLVRQFREKFPHADWLLMVDADMEFRPDALDRLLDNADPVERPIVGGLCFGLVAGGWQLPTLYDLMQDDNGNPGFVRYRQWEPDSLMKVAGTGTAFLLIHRSVFDRFDAQNANPKPGTTAFNRTFPYFQETEFSGRPIGEDLTFCLRAGFLGIPVYVDTSVHIGHVKGRILNFDSYVAEYAMRAQMEAAGDETGD